MPLDADNTPPEDRISDPGLEDLALKAMLRMFDEMKSLEEQLEHGQDIDPRSSLSRDDELSDPFKISHYAASQAVVALATLTSLRQLITSSEDAENIAIATSAFGPYALIRNSIDSSAMALWLLRPSSRVERLKRIFAIQENEAHNSLQARKSSRSTGADEWYEARMARIAEVSEAAGVTKIPRLATTTSILSELSGSEELAKFAPLTSWQVCSGMAHGKTWASLLVNDFEAISHDSEARESVARVTISYVSLAYYCLNAFALAKAAKQLFDRQRVSHR